MNIHAQTQNLLRFFLFFLLLLFPIFSNGQSVIITEEEEVGLPNESSLLEIRSDNKGILIPRMTTMQREAIISPSNGLMVFDIDESGLYYYDATKDGKAGWVKMVVGDASVESGTAGKIAYFKDATTIGAHSSVELSNSAEEPIFVVKNSEDQIVFAVYEKGVRIYVDSDTVSGGKTARGGFAVGGFTTGKSEIEYLKVTPDSVRVLVNADTTKTARGGFAVGGFTTGKGFQELLRVTHDSTRIYIDDRPGKTARGGFAVGGFTSSKQGVVSDFFNVETSSNHIINPSEARILWYPIKNAFLAGQVLIESPDSVGNNSMVSGFESKAIGDYSQAFGYEAIARGAFSTAIGKNAEANLDNSFALGEGAIALNIESYAIGRGAIASGFRSFAFGSSGVDSVGQTTGVAYASGDYSFAIGQGSNADGFGSATIGLANVASGNYSIALGYKTTAFGYGATTMGRETFALGMYSTAIGSYSAANGSNSFAGGYNSIAEGFTTFAYGTNAQATHQSSIAMGEEAAALNNWTVAIGNNVQANALNSFAIGRFAVANGATSFSIGSQTLTNGAISVALGYKTVTNGNYAVAMGGETSANNYYAIAMGNKTIANGHSSTAMGINTTAEASYSTAMGNNSISQGDISTAMGFFTTAQAYASVVLGRYNLISGTTNMWVDDDPLFVIGNGSDNNIRSNAMTVLKNGRTGIGTASPSHTLHVDSPLDEEPFRVQVNGLTRFSVNADQSVVIGTNSSTGPVRGLYVYGNTGIGITNPTTILHVNHPNNYNNGFSLSNNSTSNRWHFYVRSSDNDLRIYYNGVSRGNFSSVTGAYSALSDKNFKENVKSFNDLLDKVLKLDIVEYNIKGHKEKKQIGLIAQDVEKLFPEIVSAPANNDDDAAYSLNYAATGVIALKAIQEQQKIIEEQQELIKKQNIAVEDLTNRLEKLELLLAE